MKRTLVLAIVASLALSLTDLSTVSAEESFLSRINPFRLLRKRGEEKSRSTHSQLTTARERIDRRGINKATNDGTIVQRSGVRQQDTYGQRFGQNAGGDQFQQFGSLGARFEDRDMDSHRTNDFIADYYQRGSGNGRLGQPGSAGSLPSLDEMRAELEARGIDSKQVRQRIARMEQARSHSGKFGKPIQSGSPPDLEAMRQELHQRGIDPAKIDQRLALKNEARERGGRFARKLDGAPPADFDSIRERLSRKGVDPTSLNARFGRPADGSGGDASSSHASRYGMGRIRRR